MSRKGYLFITLIVVLFLIIIQFSPYNDTQMNHGVKASIKSQALNQTSKITKIDYKNGSSNVTYPMQLTSNVSSNKASRFLYVPNTKLETSINGGIVQPLYTTSPAPMGIGDFGLMNSSGNLVGENYNSSSFSGTINFSNLSAFYLSNDAPNSLSIQLNTVLKNVTLFGNSSYTFWVQSVALLSARTNTITFVDNIWNFSSPQASVGNSSIITTKGKVFPYPGVYITVGPTINITFPFTLRLYQVSLVNSSNNELYFNYSLTESNGTVKNENYNTVQFVSSSSSSSNYIAKQANFSVSGTQLAPNGLLYDSEFVIGGPGGGSTTSVYSINASMNLTFLNNKGKYVNVPSAYDFGANTGETSEGISEYYSASNTVHFSAGPSLLYGLWNTSSNGTFSSVSPGYDHFIGNLSPSNGFMFVSKGSQFSTSNSSWAPLDINGLFSFYLPPGNYSAIEMMSFYTPRTFELGQSVPAMIKNSAVGIYTPLYAFDNSQLGNITYSGDGTQANPYLLYTGENVTSINSIFSKMNDFTFPVFPGILLKNITDHVIISNPPSFEVSYLTKYYGELTALGLPVTNNLMIQIYGASNITVENGKYITGWFSSLLTGFPLANLIFWNSTNIAVDSNYFASMGSSVLIYNDNSTYSNVSVNSNIFQVDYSTTNFFSSQFLYGYDYYGLEIYSSNNTIYNNYFATSVPVYSPSYDLYTNSVNVTYENTWNIPTKAGDNIIGGNSLSGNYWMNYNNVKPFTDYGQISGQGDNSPLTYNQKVTFNPTNISLDTPWEILVYKYTELNNTPSIMAGLQNVYGKTTFTLPNGTYYYAAIAQGNFYETLGTFTLSGSNIFTTVNFESFQTYNVTFSTQGLANDTKWIVTFGGVTAYTNASEVIYLGVPNGTYNYSVETNLYNATPSSGHIVVHGTPVYITEHFTSKTYSIEFIESGLPSGVKWSVTLGGVKGSASGEGILFTNVPIGEYSYSIANVSGYLGSSGGVVYVNGSNQIVYVTFRTGITNAGIFNEEMAYLAVGIVIGISLTYAWRKIRE